jgi:RNA polymerase sigma factor (sigma-70 family)
MKDALSVVVAQAGRRKNLVIGIVASSELEQQIERHRAAVARYIRSLIRNAAEAEDLTQETFLRAHNRVDSLRDPGALEGWLYQIATETAHALRNASAMGRF